jgi:hypothetical protein
VRSMLVATWVSDSGSPPITSPIATEEASRATGPRRRARESSRTMRVVLGSKARRLNPKGTQEEVARAAGVSRATVSRIERGDRRGGGRLLTPQF